MKNHFLMKNEELRMKNHFLMKNAKLMSEGE